MNLPTPTLFFLEKKEWQKGFILINMWFVSHYARCYPGSKLLDSGMTKHGYYESKKEHTELYKLTDQ